MDNLAWLKDVDHWKEHDLSIHSNAENRSPSEKIFRENRIYLKPEHENIYFTYREMDVAKLLLKAMTYKMIAEYMQISRRTVESYITHMKFKLNCDSKAELIECIKGLTAIKDYSEPTNSKEGR